MKEADCQNQLQKAQKQWEQEKEQRKKRPTPEKFSSSGYPFQELYTPNDIQDFDYLEHLGFPGQYPYTRGVQPTMYRGRVWTMRQYAGFGTAEQSNERYKYLLNQGQTGLSVAFDLPTQIGYDSDDSLAAGEVGKVGVAIDSLADMEVLFRGIPLDKVSTSMTINATASVLLAMYMAVADQQGVHHHLLSGTIQNDILKEYIARGTYRFPPQPSMKIITDIFSYCSQNLPKWNTISISGYHIREAGATAAQEIAFTLADGIAYVQAAIDTGQDPNVFGQRLSFFFAAHNDLFEEIAKFRAARRLWAKLMKEQFGVTNEKAMQMRFHTQTGGSTLTAQQPENNIVRVAIQALSAILGGTQSLHTNSFDEALALPSEESVRIALRTQQVLAHESGVTNTVDPLGGSYYLELITDQLEKKAMGYISTITKMGGMVKAIEDGYVQREIMESAYRYQKDIESEASVIVGVNQFQVEELHHNRPLLRVDPELEIHQIQQLQEIKGKRNASNIKDHCSRLKVAAEKGENIMPHIYDAVRSYTTLGEISYTLSKVYGEYMEAPVL